MITAANIRAVGVEFVGRHSLTGGATTLVYRSPVYRELVVKIVRPGPGESEIRTIYVAGDYVPSFDRAAELLDARRSSRRTAA